METSIISDIAEYINDSLPVIEYNSNGQNKECTVSVLDSNYKLTIPSGRNYNILKDKYAYNMLLLFNKNSRRNIVSSELFKANLRASYDNKYNDDDPEREQSINRILNKIKNTTIGKQIRTDIRDYVYTYYASYMYQQLKTPQRNCCYQ